MKWPVLLIGGVLVAAVLIFAVSYGSPGTRNVATSTTASTTEILPGVLSVPFSEPDLGFSVMRPETITPLSTGFEGFLPVTGHAVIGLPLLGESFKGTNLVEAGLFIGASSDAKSVNACLSPSGEEQPLGTKDIGGAVFKVFSSTGAGAGNTYETTTYRTVRNGNCLELVELLHSGNIGNYPPGEVKQFDHDAFKTILDKMLATFTFTGIAGSGVEGVINTVCKTDASDPACTRQERTIQAYQGISSVALFKSSLDGTFRSVLPPGQYELRVDTGSSTHCVSVGVVVTGDSFISTNISCEAGVQ